MPRKILRDIKADKPDIITLRSDDGITRKNLVKNALDCSTTKRKETSQKQSINDISGTKNDTPVYFLHIEENQVAKASRTSEILRLATVGVIILLILNLLNIYQKGLNLKDSVMATAYSGYETLLQAGEQAKNSDFANAELTFNEATQSFTNAQQTISFLSTNQNYFLSRERTVESVDNLLSAAKNISSAGENFSRGIENLKVLPALFINENLIQEQRTTSEGEQESATPSLTEKLKSDFAYVQKATGQMEQAVSDLKKVSPDVLPPTFRERLQFIFEQSDGILNLLHETSDEFPAILDMLGDRYPHRYLVLLQNDAEARPTGGFIGSYLIIDLNDGFITKFEFHDVYELDGQLQEEITPPPDIAALTDKWRMRDSNYSPDFTISAEKAAWFLQKQNGPSVDSVIAINQSFISDLLELTGPLQISNLKSELTSENFQLILNYIIEMKLTGDQSPKQIMEEIIPAFKGKLFSQVPLENVIKKVFEGINSKKIMLYSRKNEVQNLFDRLNLSGRVDQTAANEDYLNVIVSSIGGNKSDRYIQQNIQHYTLINKEGSLINEVAVTRKHTWNGKDLEHMKQLIGAFGYDELPDYIADILGRGENKSYVKIYVPKGSTLVDTNGIDKSEVQTFQDEEINKTYFMFKMDVRPASQQKIAISYFLPFKLNTVPADSYKFFSQTQPSINAGRLEKKIFLKPGLVSYRQYPDTLKEAPDGTLIYESSFTDDFYISTLIGG